MQGGKGKELGCETGLEVQAMVSQAGVWVPGRNVGLLESLELERFGQVLGRGPLFSLQTSQRQSWFHITNTEPLAAVPPPLPLPRDQNLTLGKG